MRKNYLMRDATDINGIGDVKLQKIHAFLSKIDLRLGMNVNEENGKWFMKGYSK